MRSNASVFPDTSNPRFEDIVMNIRVTEAGTAAGTSWSRPLVRTVIVGHVDHGKSTLIGRLLHETGSLPDGKMENLQAVSARRGMAFEWSFLLDALQTERDQGITIDTSQIHFRTDSRDVVLIDAPGHTEFLRNMITGASQADAALLIIDASEGVREQTRRHGYLLHLLGVRQVAVVINKMDRIGFDLDRFHAIAGEISDYLDGLGVTPTAVIPISARHGDGVAHRTPSIAWFTGPTVIEAIDGFAPAPRPSQLDLRFSVQAVYKFDDRRIVAGRVETGHIAVGDEIVVMPAGKAARVRAIEAWPVPDQSRVPQVALAGQSIGITLDRELFVARGDVIALERARPLRTDRLRARVFWLHDKPIEPGLALTVRVGTAEAQGVVTAVSDVVDPGELKGLARTAIGQNNVGEIEITLARPLAVDAHEDNPRTGRVVLQVEGRIAGGGLVLTETSAAASPAMVLTTHLARDLAALSAAERLTRARAEIDGRIVFTTSFGLEDQIITHLLHQQKIAVDVVTLDTGRLFSETHDVWAETERRYGIRIRAFYPDAAMVETLVASQGINGFYASPDARLACCHARKVVPLNRALAGAQAWITGLRAEQSRHRGDLQAVTLDAARGLIKLSPLFDWSRETALAYAEANGISLNALHARGFASIGCAPCTRAIAPGEPERAGRWWWEQEGKKECGLHTR
jgi:bifunctional enzyme CysN/CysC